MAHKFNPAKKDKLDNEWRRNNLPPLPTLMKLGLGIEDTVADIGCGIGYFSIPAAQVVNVANKVYALDTSEEMLDYVENRAIAEGLLNIVAIKTEEYDLKLLDESVSFALIVNVIHEIDDKSRLLKDIYRILKPTGRIAVVDWKKVQTEMGPPVDHRISQEEVHDLLAGSGFEVVNETEFAGCHYGLVAVKK